MFKFFVLAALMAVAAAKPGFTNSYAVAPTVTTYTGYGHGYGSGHYGHITPVVKSGFYGNVAPLAYSAGYASPYTYNNGYEYAGLTGYNGYGQHYASPVAYSAHPYRYHSY